MKQSGSMGMPWRTPLAPVKRNTVSIAATTNAAQDAVRQSGQVCDAGRESADAMIRKATPGALARGLTGGFSSKAGLVLSLRTLRTLSYVLSLRYMRTLCIF